MFRTELISVTLPPIRTIRPSHVESLELTESKIDFHVLHLFRFAPIGSPKNLNGNAPELQERKVTALSKKLLSTFTPYNLLLKKLTFNPETNSNPLKMVFILYKITKITLPIRIVSSAN